MDLRVLWEKYREETEFNISVLPKEILNKGEKIRFVPKSIIVSRGEFPTHIFFIQSGTAVGIRNYDYAEEKTMPIFLN